MDVLKKNLSISYMNKEFLIKKWLDNELSVDESKKFQQLEEYNSYMKLSKKSQLFKAPAFNYSKVYLKLQSTIDKKKVYNIV